MDLRVDVRRLGVGWQRRRGLLGREWRQLATFEAINGWIIFGWATALIMAVIQRLYFPAK